MTLHCTSSQSVCITKETSVHDNNRNWNGQYITIFIRKIWEHVTISNIKQYLATLNNINKLGLSCAKLRESLILSGLNKILVYLYWLIWFWIANLAFEFYKFEYTVFSLKGFPSCLVEISKSKKHIGPKQNFGSKGNFGSAKKLVSITIVGLRKNFS